MSVLRTTRLLRVFKLARSWKELNRIITAVLRSFSQVCYLSLLLLLFLYIFALMGMQLFGYSFSSCSVSGAQQLCPPGVDITDCPSYPDCYVPCSDSQVFSWFSMPGERGSPDATVTVACVCCHSHRALTERVSGYAVG